MWSLKNILTAQFAFFASLNPLVVAIGAGVMSALAAFHWLNDQWSIMLAKIDLMAVGSFAGSISFSPMALMDTFIPLTETLTFFSAWLGVLLTASVIRIVKSFVPAIAT